MASLNDFPLEILEVVLRLATELGHPDALESPLVDWSPKTATLFQRGATLRAEALKTKASVVRVSRQWNAIATPLLYEHAHVDTRQNLARILDTFSASSNENPNLASLVKRLDVELAEKSPALHDESLVGLLSSCSNLRTLVMGLHGVSDFTPILDAIPSTVRTLLWKVVDPPRYPPVAIHLSTFVQFLQSHPRVETIAVPFGIRSWPQIASPSPHPSLREWFLQAEDQVSSFDTLQGGGFFPCLQSRLLTWPLNPRGLEMLILASGAIQDTLVNPFPGTNTFEPNPTITRFGLVETFDNAWPSDSLAHKLRIMRGLCPNLRQLDITLLKGSAGIFSSSIYRSEYPVPRLDSVTTLCLQRAYDTPLRDPIGLLRPLLQLPFWRDTFPSLNTIRIMDDVDLDGARAHPDLDFAKEAKWTIRIEDRFGQLLTL